MKNNTVKGFSLVEMLLTVMVVMGLLVAVFNLLEDYAETELARSTTKYMENIALAVQDIIDDPVYFQEVYAQANARPSDVLELTMADLVDGFGAIPGSTRLNENIRNQTPIGSEVTIMLRIADNPASDNDVQALEIIVATMDLILDERVRRAATEAGAYGGMLRDGSNQVTSAFASWSVNVNDLAGTAWAGRVAANPPTTEDGAYLVHYRHASFEDAAGDYMFRISIPGRPELNRMYTDLNMGTHNIMGTDNLNLSGNLTLDGGAMINRSVVTGGNTTVNKGDVIAGGRFQANSMQIKGTGSGVTGTLGVDDSINISRVNLNGVLNAETAELRGGVTSSSTLTTTALALRGGVTRAGQINATNLHGSGAKPDVIISGQLNSSRFNTQTLNVQNGNVGVLDAKIGGNATIGSRLNAPNIGFGNASVGTFGTCDEGC